MTEPVYPNKDAEFLHSLGATFIADEDFDTGMRLQAAARHLQSLDDRLAALSTGDQFIAGKRAAYAELYARSNLPPEERTMPLAAAKLGIGPAVQVRRVPTGVSGLHRQEPPTKRPKPTAKPSSKREMALSRLSVDLDLAALNLKLPSE